MLQRIIILFFSIIVWRGAGERAQIWEIVVDQPNHLDGMTARLISVILHLKK